MRYFLEIASLVKIGSSVHMSVIKHAKLPCNSLWLPNPIPSRAVKNEFPNILAIVSDKFK